MALSETGPNSQEGIDRNRLIQAHKTLDQIADLLNNPQMREIIEAIYREKPELAQESGGLIKLFEEIIARLDQAGEQLALLEPDIEKRADALDELAKSRLETALREFLVGKTPKDPIALLDILGEFRPEEKLGLELRYVPGQDRPTTFLSIVQCGEDPYGVNLLSHRGVRTIRVEPVK